ncbi:MAG: hypothetical protein Kow0010_17650 [Dehalococcoidia bacterium]
MAKHRGTIRNHQRPFHERFLWAGVTALVLAVVAVVVGGYVMSEDARGDGASASDGLGLRLASWSGGGTLRIDDPEKPTLLLTIAGWCSTCIQPARDLIEVHNTFGERVTIVAYSVDPGETEGTLRRFRDVAGNGNYLWAFDNSAVTISTLGVASLDTVTILDADGKKVFQAVRPSADRIKSELQELLNGSSQRDS